MAESQFSELCEGCRTFAASEIFQTSDVSPDALDLILELRIASIDAVGTCELCQAILRELSSGLQRRQIRPPFILGLNLDPNDRSTLVLVKVTTPSGTSFSWDLPLLTLSSEDGLARRNISPRRRIGSPGSTKTVETIRSWIEQCDNLHKSGECGASRRKRANSETPRLPTRVIDVGLSDSSSPYLLHAVGLRGNYVALTHRWGGFNGVLTTKATLEEYERALPMKTVPQTFKDAIDLTRRLGIQYLWIDILTIVQDDDDEWIREAAAFNETFEGAYLMVAATSAEDASAGMFAAREENVIYAEIPRKSSVNLEGSLYLSPYQPPSFDVVEKSPLNRRAWVMQETLLSQRILHVGYDQVYWQCDYVFCAENGTVNAQQTMRNRLLPFWIDSSLQGLTSLPNLMHLAPEAMEMYLCDAWTQFIMTYTRCQISFSEDRLPGVAQIAAKIERKTNFTYLQGHWFGRWPFSSCSLLWFTAGPSLTTPPHDRRPTRTVSPTSTVTPSWSWAFLDGGLDFLVHYYCGEKSGNFHDEFAPIARLGRMLEPLQRGPILHIPLALLGSTRLFSRSQNREFDAHCRDGTSGPTPRCYTVVDENKNGIGWACFDNDDIEPKQFRCLGICYAKNGASFEQLGSKSIVLLLEETNLASPHKWYRRIGVGMISQKELSSLTNEDEIILV